MKHAKKDCFAYIKETDSCNALNVEGCEKCKFYTTKKRFEERQNAIQKRLGFRTRKN